MGKLFKGRDAYVQELHDALSKRNDHPHAAAILGKALHGLGGIGKTRLAVEYAWQHEPSYTALLFVVADPPEKLRTNIAALCEPLILDLPEQHAREEEIRYAAALQWLQQHSSWLLILDNVDTRETAMAVEKVLGVLRGGHVLITSRWTQWSNQVEPMPLDVLNEEAAMAFLQERTDRYRRKTDNDYIAAKLIVNDLGGLALALEQAGAYICTSRFSFDKYREAWYANREKVLSWFDEQQMQYPKSVAITWQTSFDLLRAEAKVLLNRVAWLAPDPIPESLFDVQI